MKTMKQVLFDNPTLCYEGWERLKRRYRMLHRNGRQAYFYPGAKRFPLHLTNASGDDANMCVLPALSMPPIRVRALPEWKAWEAAREDTAAYVAAFCAANHLTR